jgi:hypothetical protein
MESWNLGILEFQILVAGEPIYGYIKIYVPRYVGIKPTINTILAFTSFFSTLNYHNGL